jgi:hypothetical protein
MKHLGRNAAVILAGATVLFVLYLYGAVISEGVRLVPNPGVQTFEVPGGLELYSRVARGTWDVSGPAERIDLNGRRYYLSQPPAPVHLPDLQGFVLAGAPIWPDQAWYLQAGDRSFIVWARTRDGSYWRYDVDPRQAIPDSALH